MRKTRNSEYNKSSSPLKPEEQKGSRTLKKPPSQERWKGPVELGVRDSHSVSSREETETVFRFQTSQSPLVLGRRRGSDTSRVHVSPFTPLFRNLSVSFVKGVETYSYRLRIREFAVWGAWGGVFFFFVPSE